MYHTHLLRQNKSHTSFSDHVNSLQRNKSICFKFVSSLRYIGLAIIIVIFAICLWNWESQKIEAEKLDRITLVAEPYATKLPSKSPTNEPTNSPTKDPTSSPTKKPTISKYSTFFKQKSIGIISMVKNSEKVMLNNLQILDRISELFNHTCIIILESNSSDLTPKILRDWSNISSRTAIKQLYVGEDYRSLINMEIEMNDELKKYHLLPDRISRFTIFRNFLLQKISHLARIELQEKLQTTMDYLLIMDLDIFGFEYEIFFKEFYFLLHGSANEENTETDIVPNVVLCGNAIISAHWMRDTYASVDMEGRWYFMVDREHKYGSIHSGWPMERFQRMRSCFSGAAIYSNFAQNIQYSESEQKLCKYQLIFNRSLSDTFNIEYGTVWNTNMSAKEKEMKRSELNSMIAFADFKHTNFFNNPPTSYICEHLAYHYCLQIAYNYSIFMSQKSFVYFRPLNRFPWTKK